jgi:hypothetical protein
VRTWDGCLDKKCLKIFIDCSLKTALHLAGTKKPIVFVAADRNDLVEELKTRLGAGGVEVYYYEKPIVHYVDLTLYKDSKLNILMITTNCYEQN